MYEHQLFNWSLIFKAWSTKTVSHNRAKHDSSNHSPNHRSRYTPLYAWGWLRRNEVEWLETQELRTVDFQARTEACKAILVWLPTALKKEPLISLNPPQRGGTLISAFPAPCNGYLDMKTRMDLISFFPEQSRLSSGIRLHSLLLSQNLKPASSILHTDLSFSFFSFY